MKYLYLFFLYLLVNSDCPNLCSGHGTCSSNGKCVCNTQPGLGLNKGAFDEFSWTGTCPKGQSFSYDIFKTTADYKRNLEELEFVKKYMTNSRLLFESDNGRVAAQGDNAEENETPTPSDEVTTKPTTTEPTTVIPTTAEATTTIPTTPRPTTTAPEIITKPPVIITQPPIVTLPPEEYKQPVSNNSLVVNKNDTQAIPEEEKVSSDIIIFNDKTGEIIGKVTVNKDETGNKDEISLEEVLNQLGITDLADVKIAEKPKTVAETTPTINFATTTVKATVTDTSGKKVPAIAAKASASIKKKLNSIFRRSNSRMLFDEERILATEIVNCGGTNITNGADTRMWCVESENPKDNNYFKMKLLDLNLQCLKIGEEEKDPCTGDKCKDGQAYDVYVTGPTTELEDIDSACFYLGDANAKIEDSEIFEMVGERGGEYYFSKFTEGSTVIVAAAAPQPDGTYLIDFNKSPSLVGKGSYPINRPIGDLQKSVIPGGKMIMRGYDPDTGKLGTPTEIVIDKGSINGNGQLVIEVPKAVDMNANATDDVGPEDITDEDETDKPKRRLWDERELQGTTPSNVVILQFVEYPPHSFIECSGQGNCNRQTGQCECYDGFEGDACQRTSCPNNCNNNGRCVVLNEVLGFDLTKTTTSSTFDPTKNSTENTQTVSEPFDSKLFGCICDEGHRGPDCSLYECPSSIDPSGATNLMDGDEQRDCSGRGICDYQTGTCTCFDGYYGTACENMANFI